MTKITVLAMGESRGGFDRNRWVKTCSKVNCDRVAEDRHGYCREHRRRYDRKRMAKKRKASGEVPMFGKGSRPDRVKR